MHQFDAKYVKTLQLDAQFVKSFHFDAQFVKTFQSNARTLVNLRFSSHFCVAITTWQQIIIQIRKLDKDQD